MIDLVRRAAIALTSLALATAAGLLLWQATWVRPVARTPEESFAYGSMGVAIMPVKVFRTLPELFPDRFQPGGKEAGDWVEQYGFVRGKPDVNGGLPLGLMASNHLPRSGEPSPIAFLGFSCALCHSATFERRDGSRFGPVLGAGSKTIDLFAWVDAVQGALLDESRLTPAAIERVNRETFREPLTLVERAVIANWLPAARAELRNAVTKYDDPAPAGQLRNPSAMPNGPCRTQAFRELARLILDRPGASDRAYSKLPSVFRQSDREWAQYDGSARDPLLRSILASLAAGATVDSLSRPEILADVRASVAYVKDLAGPTFEAAFPDAPIDRAKVARGRTVYAEHCDSCHGHAEGGRWVPGRRHGEILSPSEIGTDPERVEIRHYAELAQVLYDSIPADSPFRPRREDIRPGPAGTKQGYINGPIDSAFTRAPFLHNGSVPTLAQLINLRPRPGEFYRGRNTYDPAEVGLDAPDAPDAKNYHRFDTTAPGNSNRGHDYPWRYRGPGWNEADLIDLLEYLKTL